MAPKKARKKKIAAKRPAWNKGLKIGKQDALAPEQVKRIRAVLALWAIETWRSSRPRSTQQDLLELRVRDMQDRNGSIRSTIKISKKRGGVRVRCALSRLTAKALEKWISDSGKKPGDYLFPGRGRKTNRPMTQRQFSLLMKLWVADAGFDPGNYDLHSLRRTKALHILKGTGDLQAVRALLGHATIEGMSRFLGLETNADPLEVCRAFDI